MQFIVDKFNASQQETTVTMHVIEWAKYYPKLLEALAAGTPPDIAIVHASKLAQFKSLDGLVNLSSFDKEVAFEWEDFSPWIREAVTFDKNYYAVALDRYLLMTYYNKRYLKEVGLLDANGTLKAPIGEAQTLRFFHKIKTYLPSKITALGQPIDNVFPFWIWYSLYHQIEGGGAYIEDNKAAFNNASALKALQFLTRLRDEGIYAKPINDIQGYNMFKFEKSAVMLTGVWATWNFEQNEALDFGVAPFPQVFDKPAAMSDSHTLVLPKNAHQPSHERQIAAAAFANFVSHHGIDWSLAGHIPARTSLQNDEAYLKHSSRSRYKNYLDMGIAYPKHPQLGRCNDALVTIFARMMQSDQTAQEALTEALAAVNTILATNP